jgi:hypothetical protein
LTLAGFLRSLPKKCNRRQGHASGDCPPSFLAGVTQWHDTTVLRTLHFAVGGGVQGVQRWYWVTRGGVCGCVHAGVQRPWRKQVSLTRGQATALGWSGVSIALFLFGTMYLSKICGPIRCGLVCSLGVLGLGLRG